MDKHSLDKWGEGKYEEDVKSASPTNEGNDSGLDHVVSKEELESAIFGGVSDATKEEKTFAKNHSFPGACYQDEPVIRKRKTRKLKRGRRLRITLLIVLILVGTFSISAWAATRILESGKESLYEGVQISTSLEEGSSGYSDTEGKASEELSELTYAGKTYGLNESLITILVLGYDGYVPGSMSEKAGQADVAILIVINEETGGVSFINVSADETVESDESATNVGVETDEMDTFLSYTFGETYEVLGDLNVSAVFTMNLDGISSLTDTVGGIYLTPLQSIPGTTIVEGESTVLSSNNVYKYLQWCHATDPDASSDRQARQIQYIQAFAEQTLTPKPGQLSVLIDVFTTTADYSITDLSASEFLYLASSLLGGDDLTLNVITLPGVTIQRGLSSEFYIEQDVFTETILGVFYHEIE